MAPGAQHSICTPREEKSCRGGCPGAETPNAGCLTATAQATGSPVLQLPWGRHSGPHGLCETTAAAAAQLPVWPSLPLQDKVPPRGTAARRGCHRGFVARGWQCRGKELTPAPSTGESLNQPRIPPARAQEAPLPAQYQVLCLASSGALLGKDRASLFQPCAAACAVQGLNGRLYAVAAVTSHTLATANGSKQLRGLCFCAGCSTLANGGMANGGMASVTPWPLPALTGGPGCTMAPCSLPGWETAQEPLRLPPLLPAAHLQAGEAAGTLQDPPAVAEAEGPQWGLAPTYVSRRSSANFRG